MQRGESALIHPAIVRPHRAPVAEREPHGQARGRRSRSRPVSRRGLTARVLGVFASSAVTPDAQIRETAAELDWPRLLERIASFCLSDVAARAVRALSPEASLELAQARMRRTREAIALAEIAPLPRVRIDDQAEPLARLVRGGSLEARELRSLAGTLEQCGRLDEHLARHAELAPELGEWLRTAPVLAELAEAIRRSIGPDDAILDSASPALARARKRAHAERDELRQRLAAVLTRLAPAMQGQYVAEREGRYVLPVRSDAPFRVDGLVLGSSASGSTVYVEPREAHDLGNRVQLSEAEVRAEETRVLAELNARIGSELPAVTRGQTACIEAELLSALADYARSMDALALLPEPDARLDLRQMRHPLLDAERGAVVPNDLRIEAGRGLVLSGPNAGGKTVALECFGLAAWMARAGIPLPVAPGSAVGWFETVLTDIGDHQSLLHSLSTFSAHMKRMAAAIAVARPGVLVLIDELAGGTDPDEGAALAIAIVEALVARGAALAVTTHHDRLEAFAASHPGLENAAVGFDRERLAPTFALAYGAPGASGALLTAERFGLGAELIARARALLPEGAVKTRALLAELDQRRTELGAASAALEAERRATAALRRELEQERERRQREDRGRLDRELERVLDEVQRARARLRDAEARLGASAPALREASAATNELARFVSIGGALREVAARLDPPPIAGAPLDWAKLALGARVLLVATGATGTVVAKPRRGQVTVAVGAIKTTLGIDGLSLAPASADAGPGKAANPARARRGAPPRGGPEPNRLENRPEPHRPEPHRPEPMRSRQNTLSLVGERVEPALERFDQFVDGLLREGEACGFIVHGHGTGALKSAVRQHAERHPNVAHSGPAPDVDGGDALTVVWLR
jgi:DNA mismatch repair protein MutS2